MPCPRSRRRRSGWHRATKTTESPPCSKTCSAQKLSALEHREGLVLRLAGNVLRVSLPVFGAEDLDRDDSVVALERGEELGQWERAVAGKEPVRIAQLGGRPLLGVVD